VYHAQKIRALEEQLAGIPLNLITVADLAELLEKALPKLTAIKSLFKNGTPD